MAIVNRSLDLSEQTKEESTCYGAIPTGSTVLLKMFAYPCTLQQIKVAAIGLSGSPAWTFYIGREYAGAGYSLQAVTGALTVQAVGTSGIQSASMLAAGSTLLNIQAGDVLYAVTATANTNVLGAAVDVVFTATQDIKSFFGV